MNESEEKYIIRKRIKLMKNELDLTSKEIQGENVFIKVCSMPEFIAANHILLYNALSDELPTHLFLERLYSTKNIYLPRVEGMNLSLHRYEKDSLAVGAFHISEPTDNNMIDPSSIELAIIPAVAVSRNGTRLGRGKGYYDRLLAAMQAFKIAICFDFQLLSTPLPMERHDIKMDAIVTANELIRT